MYGTEDIESSEDDDVIATYSDGASLRTYSQRSIFTLDTHNNNLLFNEGFFCSHDSIMSNDKK